MFRAIGEDRRGEVWAGEMNEREEAEWMGDIGCRSEKDEGLGLL